MARKRLTFTPYTYFGDKPVIHARASDFQIRPNLETEKVEFTYLPTGKTILLSVDQAANLGTQLIAAIRGDGPREIQIDTGFFV